MTQIYEEDKHNDLEVDTYMSASDDTATTAATSATAVTTATAAITAIAATDSLVRCLCGMLYFRETGYEKRCSQCTARVYLYLTNPKLM